MSHRAQLLIRNAIWTRQNAVHPGYTLELTQGTGDDRGGVWCEKHLRLLANWRRGCLEVCLRQSEHASPRQTAAAQVNSIKSPAWFKVSNSYQISIVNYHGKGMGDVGSPSNRMARTAGWVSGFML